MSRHTLTTPREKPVSAGPGRFNFNRERDPRLPQGIQPGAPQSAIQYQYPNWPGRNGPGSPLDNFRFGFERNRPGPEFSNTGRRLRNRPETFDEQRERQGQNLFQNFGAIARGEEGQTLRRDPITGQPIERGRGQKFIHAGGTFNPNQTIPSFNIEATKVDVGGAQRANSQAFSAQRQAAARGAIGTFGGRLGARSGAAGLSAVNQSAAPLFAAQADANASLQAGAAFQDQASEQAVDFRNLQTRLFGVQGQQDMLSQFRGEAGQRADIQSKEDSLKLGLEQLKVGKEGQDMRAALEKRRLGILSFTARERAAMDRYNALLRRAELQFEMDQASKGFGFGDFLGLAARVGAAYFTGGVSEAAYQGANAASSGFGQSGSGPLYDPLQPPG